MYAAEPKSLYIRSGGPHQDFRHALNMINKAHGLIHKLLDCEDLPNLEVTLQE